MGKSVGRVAVKLIPLVDTNHRRMGIDEIQELAQFKQENILQYSTAGEYSDEGLDGIYLVSELADCSLTTSRA